MMRNTTVEKVYTSSLAVLAGFLPLYLIRFSLGPIPTNLFEFLVLVVSIFGLLQRGVRRQLVQALRDIPRPVLVMIASFLVAACISTAISPHRETSLGIVKGWIWVPLLFAWQIYAQAANQAMGKLVLRALILSGVAVSLAGLAQLLFLDRVTSVYDVPNSLALFVAPIFVLAVLAKPVIGKYQFGQWSAAVLLLALIATGSLAGIITVTVVILFASLQRKTSISFVAILGIVLLLAAPVLWQKVAYLVQPNSSAHVRLQLWSISAELIREHPVTGIGLGVFEPFYQQKLHERFSAGVQGLLPEFVFRDSHNWILSFWLNCGLLGMVSFAGIHVYIFQKTKKLQPTHYALMALLLFGLVDTIYWKNDLAALHWMLLALVARL